MTDPYSVLGVAQNASDDAVKRAYRELARKYHPDNYQDNPLSDLAEEKMKEVNEAYEEITRIRSGGGSSGSYGGAAYQRQSTTATSPLYQRVRQSINSGNIDAAEQILRSAPDQDAEWHFLAGCIAYRRGWLDEARQHYQIACSADPGNAEYRQAYNMMQQGGQSYHPYGTGSGGAGGSMDCCTSLLCMNCLCGGCN